MIQFFNVQLVRAAVILVVVLITSVVSASTHAQSIATTTDIGVPTRFGAISDNILPDGKPYLGAEIVEIRLKWTIDVATGYDAQYVQFRVGLPTVGQEPVGIPPVTGLSFTGADQGWSGSGQFVFEDTYTLPPLSTFFDETGRRYSDSAFYDDGGGSAPSAASVVTGESFLEIDYVVPEPGSALLLLGGCAGLMRRLRD